MLFSFLFVGVSVFGFLLLVWGFGAQFVTNLIGFGYPLYESYRSLSSSSSTSANAATTHSQQQWLTYWIIYGTFSLVESLTDFFLYWVPLYHIVKIAFLVWCFLPQTRGAEVIYAKVVEPVLVRYEGRIDQVGRDSKRAVNKVVADVAQEVANAESTAAATEGGQ
jgi:receptor expression-enhancing protein 5/6